MRTLVCVVIILGACGDRGQVQEDRCAAWHCSGDAVGDTCRALFDALPPGAGPWRCHQAKGSWHCDGQRLIGAPGPARSPCARGWTCATIAPVGVNEELRRCSRPVGPEDAPAIEQSVRCVRGSAFGGLRCTIVGGAESCAPGEKRWCRAEAHRWGQARCGPDGRWMTCHEVHADQRPDTLCACYHSFFEGDCCERSDCKVVERDDGSTSDQVCPIYEGRPCQPCSRDSDCAAGGNQCLNFGESYCTKAPCGDSCPGAFLCAFLGGDYEPSPGDLPSFCVPNMDLRCYL